MARHDDSLARTALDLEKFSQRLSSEMGVFTLVLLRGKIYCRNARQCTHILLAERQVATRIWMNGLKRLTRLHHQRLMSSVEHQYCASLKCKEFKWMNGPLIEARALLTMHLMMAGSLGWEEK
jgi:hypothetical protein